MQDQSEKASGIASTSTIQLPDDIDGWSCDGDTRGVKLPQSEAIDAQNRFGWSCTAYPDFVYEGETAYICSLGCSAPSTPGGAVCQAPGYLSESVIVNGEENIPHNWECGLQSNTGGVDVYECDIPCRLPEPPCSPPSYLEDN